MAKGRAPAPAGLAGVSAPAGLAGASAPAELASALAPAGLAGASRLHGDLTADYLEEQRLLPLEVTDGRLVLASAGQPDPQAVAELERLLDARADIVPAVEEALLEAVRAAYAPGASTAAELIEELEPGTGPDAADLEAHDLEGLANQPPVVRLVNLLLSEAVGAGASDVHLEAMSGSLRVRYRIDGVLQDAPSPPANLRAAIVSRLKIMAELDIAERRLPQDGRIRLREAGREVDVRVSTLPTLHGESVVLRLLDGRRRHEALDGLGMAADALEGLRHFSQRPQGVLLVTGPTGSGKTTTLYAIVERISTGREKIVSVEDPVEYQLPGVVQIPVRPAAGLGFARALRSILRHDPDVLLVGEMRDPETAAICTQASLTGHLVLSTLHTNDAPSALTRLLDLGVADYLVASTVEAVLAQRLVRRVCPACAVEEPVPGPLREEMAADGVEALSLRRGRGCAECRDSGYRGRTGIFELLVVDDEIRAALLRRPELGTIRRLGAERGMRSLRADGWRQVAAGLTTPEEVLRVTAA